MGTQAWTSLPSPRSSPCFGYARGQDRVPAFASLSPVAYNPMALLLSAAMMLDHLGEAEAALRVRAALEAVLREGRKLTRDLGGTAGTTEIAEAIASRV